MAVVKMNKIAVIGLDRQKESIMSGLMDFGAVELSDQKSRLPGSELESLLAPDEVGKRAAELDAEIARAESALNFLEKYDPAREPLFRTRRRVSAAAAEKIRASLSEGKEKTDRITELEERLRQANEEMNRLRQQEALIRPWIGYATPLEMVSTPKAIIHEGVVPAAVDINGLLSELEDFGGIVAKLINSDRELYYIAFICLKSLEEQILDTLKQKGFSEVYFTGLKGTAADNLRRLSEEMKAVREKINSIEQEAADTAFMRQDIEAYRDILAIEADKEKIRSRLLKTRETFYLEGWIPERLNGKASELLERLGCCYTFAPPQEDEEVPVLLENKNFFVPFEAITEMYSLPDYRGFDPTGIFALFYAVFFGIMLSDAGYGVIMAAACFAVLKKFNLEGMTRKMITLFFYCGISTIIWGALFGGVFGDFIQVFARVAFGKEVVIDPLWFNPLDDPMKMLIFSLALGIIHLFIGMGIKAYMQIKDGHWFDAVCDEGFWYLTITGLIALLGGESLSPALPQIGKWVAVVGAAGLLLTGGRDKKGFGKITGGLSNLYNITSYLSDILSYARLLALGLATGVIAQVVNTMGSLFGGGVMGIIVLIVVFIFGHTLNFGINALGAFIHSSRLQYVEFFGKFYEDGGEPFDPFRKKTKYIRIEQEEEQK